MSHITYDNIKEEVVKILENNGVVVQMENDGDAILDIADIDSITFISFLSLIHI